MDRRTSSNTRPKTCVEGSKLNIREDDKVTLIKSPRRGSEPKGTSFANPTLSSLNKSRPIAIIKAYDDVSDHRSLLEKTKILSKLKSSSISSPMLQQRKLELEEIINSKSFSIIKSDLLMLAVDGREFIRVLSCRYADAAYRLEMASSTKVDRTTRAVENFVSSSEQRTLQVKELESKIKEWSETLTTCSEIAAEAKCDVSDNLMLLLEKASIVYDVHKKNSFLWMDKIVQANIETMCHYFDYLDFNEVVKICQTRIDLHRLAQLHGMTPQDYPNSENRSLLNEVIIMAEVAAKEAVLSINRLFFDNVVPLDEEVEEQEENDKEVEEERHQSRQKENEARKRVKFTAVSNDSSSDYFSLQGELSPESLEYKDVVLMRGDLESLLSFILIRNQRSILRLFYAMISGHDKRGKSDMRYPNNTRIRKPHSRKTWNKLHPLFLNQSSLHDYFSDYASVDNLFWQTFWLKTEDLLVQEVVQLPLEETSLETQVFLEQLQKVIRFSSEFSSQALSSLDQVYCRLRWRVSQTSWSHFQRNMISHMEVFESRNPSSALIENELSTHIGRNASLAISAIACFINDCRQEQLFDESNHCLTLTLHTFFNWLQCEDVQTFSAGVSIALIFSDMTSMIRTLNQVSYYPEVVKFTKDFVHQRIKLLQAFKAVFAENCLAAFSQELPKKDYRSRVCPEHATNSSWTDKCLESTLNPVICLLNQLSVTGEDKLSFVDIFLESLLKILLNENNDVKFSVSGSRCFKSDMEYLTDKLRLCLEDGDATDQCLSKSEAIMTLRDFTRMLVVSGRSLHLTCPSKWMMICRRKKVSPTETDMTSTTKPMKTLCMERKLNLLKCWCFYLPL